MGGIAGQWFKPFGADHRLLGAGVAVRVVLARPDALGLLARSARRRSSSGRWFSRAARPLQPLVRSAGRGLQGRDRVGARPSRGDGRRWRSRRFVGALALPAMGLVGAGFVPEMDDSEFIDRPRDAARIEPRLHAAEGAGGRRASPGCGPRSPTPTPAVGGQGDAVDEGTVFVKLMPKTERSRSQARSSPTSGASCRRWAASRASISTGFNPGEKQIQLQLRGPDARRAGAAGARRWPPRCGRCPAPSTSACRPRGRSRSSTCSSIAALAGSLGVTVGQVAQALRPAFAGIDVGDWIDPSGETRDVTIRLAPESRTVGRRSRVAAARRSADRTARRDDSARAGGARHAVDRSGAHRSPRSRPRHHRRGEHRGPAAVGGRRATSWRASTQNVTFPPGYTLSQGGETEEQRRSSRRCSSPSASR